MSERFEHHHSAYTDAIFDTVLDGLILINSQGIIQKVNPAASRIFGYSDQEMLGQNISMLMPEPDRSQHDRYIHAYQQTGKAKIIGKGREVLGRRKDGTTFAMDLAISEAIINGERMFVGATRDISEIKHMEKLYRLMSEQVEGYATMILDPSGRIKTWNEGARILKGYDADEIIGQSFERFYTSEDLAKNLPYRLLEETRRLGHVHNEGWRVRKDGTQFYADVVLNRLQEDDGSLLGYVKVTRDITNRKKMDLELQQAYANLEEFTSVASHDLRSPLRGIADLMEWITEDLGDSAPPEVVKNLERVQVRVKKMEGLIEDLLQYSRAGRASAEISLIDPVAIVHEVLEIQPVPEGFNIAVTGKTSPFKGASTPLKTSLRNLISNAIKHHDQPTGNVEVEVKTDGSYCVFIVRDDGPGIPINAHERIFKLFQTLSTNKESSGVGLAVAKRLIEAHGGYIRLECHENQRGTTFKIWWPRFETSGRKTEIQLTTPAAK